MFDIGMWELMVVGVVALIVVGPKDLPKMFRTLGQVTGKIRGMAREFQATMNAAASETGLDDITKDLKSATDIARDLRNVSSPRKMGMDAVKRAAGKALDDEPDKDRPLTETEKLAQKRHREAEERVNAARDRAAARASSQEAAADAAAIAAEDAPAPAEAEPRTGTANT